MITPVLPKPCRCGRCVECQKRRHGRTKPIDVRDEGPTPYEREMRDLGPWVSNSI